MAKKIQTKILNYRAIIEKDNYSDGSPVYNAFVPTLGITDYGSDIDKLLKSLKGGIELAIECLAQEGKEIPSDRIEETIIVNTQIPAPNRVPLALSQK